MRKIKYNLYLIPAGRSSIIDCNVIVIGYKDDFALVDTGNGEFSKQKIETLKQQGFELKNCSQLILTHIHFDHINGVHDFQRPVKMHKDDAEEVEKKNQTAIFGNEVFKDMSIAAGMHFKSFPIEQKLTDGEELSIAGQKWQVLHTPGHTKGSMCLFEEKTRTLISGDTLFANAIGRTDLYSANPEHMKETLERLKTLKIKTLLPGHGQTVEVDTAARVQKIVEYFMNIL